MIKREWKSLCSKFLLLTAIFIGLSVAAFFVMKLFNYSTESGFYNYYALVIGVILMFYLAMSLGLVESVVRRSFIKDSSVKSTEELIEKYRLVRPMEKEFDVMYITSQNNRYSIILNIAFAFQLILALIIFTISTYIYDNINVCGILIPMFTSGGIFTFHLFWEFKDNLSREFSSNHKEYNLSELRELNYGIKYRKFYFFALNIFTLLFGLLLLFFNTVFGEYSYLLLSGFVLSQTVSFFCSCYLDNRKTSK